MNLHHTWTALRHGGNLLSPKALDSLPLPDNASWGLADRLRAALVALDPGKPASATLGALLDTVLEDACGLADGWQKGSALGAVETEKLLDGTALKPRRSWTGPAGEAFVVFTTPATRIGVGKGRRPAAQVIEYLRRRRIPLGLLTNGTQWRLIWADTDSLAWVEWEADRWLAADQLSDELVVLRRVLSPAVLSQGDADRSPLLAAIRDTRRGQATLSKELGERVRCAVEILLRSRQSIVGPEWGSHKSADLYVAACHFVMRLVVTLFAEARELLPADNPIYYRAYGLRGLLDQLDRLSPERRKARTMAWPRLLALFRLLHQGSPHPLMILPAYGGDLFRPGDARGDGVQRSLALLEALRAPPDDECIHRVLVLLTRTTVKVREGSGSRTVATPVDFTELTSEYIGILYEGLLDYELHRAGDEPVVFLNLGDQPAMPLDRLEELDDKALAALVEKAKGKRQVADDEQDDGDDDLVEGAETPDDARAEEPTSGSDDPPLEGEQDSSDDLRAQARARAIAWGRRAAEVGKLVKKPRSKKADASALYEVQLVAAAKQLIADLKLPGELYLVRWGGTRKGAGTFYTRPQLTLPTVRRTLQPLIFEQAEAADERPRPPEDLLSLKVCDPAMGSGSFLVAALRVLTAAVIESLHIHGRLHQENGSTAIDCDLLPEADRNLPTEGFEERLEAIVRRAVVEHCLYGVDKDPLAVELARVSLWVETLDKRLPFTFLDHKLRCGDSLVGTWLDRFRDYPLLALDRQSPDLKYKGVNHETDVWHKALKLSRSQAITEMVDLLSGQQRLDVIPTSDAELKSATQRVRRLYRELRAVPAGRPDERARIWRERIQTDAALAKVREAFDTWCALWFWPLDRLDALPLPSELHAPSEAARSVVKALCDEHRFLHWELEFPDVFTAEGAGFHAVVGNPPWEIQKPSSKEFFSNHDPLYRAYGKQEALGVQRTLFEADPAIELQWLAYCGDFKNRGNFVRHAAEPFGDGKIAEHDGGDVSLGRGKQGAALHRTWRGRRSSYSGTSDPKHPFRHQGSADLNTYKMFAEVAHALLRGGGQFGLVMPSGIYTDKGTGDLRKLLLQGCAWRWLYGFENRDKIFDIHRSFKFCVIIAAKGGRTKVIQSAFMRRDLEDWAEAKEALDYPAERVTAFSPKSLSILEIQSERDLAVLTKIYANSVLLGDDSPDGWGIKYGTEFHMTNDSKLFPSRDKWEAKGYRPDEYGRWIGPDGDIALPLYEGRMIGQFDFSQKGWVSGKGRSAEWREIPWEKKVVEPQYLMAEADFLTAIEPRPWKLLMMNIGSATNRRTMLASLGPHWPANHSLAVLSPADADNDSLLGAVLNSFVFDWSLRLRVGGLNLSWFILEETPLATPPQVVTRIVAALVHGGHPAMAAIAARFSSRQRSALTAHERLRLRCMLDAIVAVCFGLDRDGLGWILKDCDHPPADLSDRDFCRSLDPKGFWRIDKSEPPELRQTVLSLVAFDSLQMQIVALGDRGTGITAFCEGDDGDGWLVPDTLRLADHELGHDGRAQQAQPVASVLGPRFFDWQLAQSPEESSAECERQAQVLIGRGEVRTDAVPELTESTRTKPSTAGPLFDRPIEQENKCAMITKLRIENFKAWDAANWTKGLRLARLTLVLGTNSSGKSSLLQPLRLLKQTLDSRDESAQLVLTEPLDLGSFEELVHERSEEAVLGVGIDFTIGDRSTSVDGEFEAIAGIPGSRSLVYKLGQREVRVERSGTTTAYSLSTPDANHPNWTGLDLANPKKNTRQAFRPARGFEFSDNAIDALGEPLKSQVSQGVRDLHDMLGMVHIIGPVRQVAGRAVRWEQQEPTMLGEDGARAIQVLISESRVGEERRVILAGVNRWLKHMEIADELVVKRIGRSMLYEIRIRRGDDSSNIVDVGMGVSQVLPILVLMQFVPEGSIIMLDEPTAHLHPLAESKLADAIATVAKERNLQVLIETHSEHLFRRVQFLMADGQLTPDDCALYYVERDQPAAHLVELEPDEYGRIKNWPDHLFGDSVGETERQMVAMFKRLDAETGNDG